VRTGDALAPRDFLRFCRAFGPLERNEKYDADFLLPGYPEILRLGNLYRDGKYRALFVRAEPGEILWHTDDSFRYPQPAGSIFHCRTHPETGGGTWYAGMAHACEALPSRLRERIEGRLAVHSYAFLDDRLRRDNPHRREMPPEVRRAHPPIVRPLVVRHPETGRPALLIPDCHIESISGLAESETRSLLAELLAHATGPRFSVCWQWRPGDIAVWDNRSAMHAGSPFDEREARLMYRVTFTGPDTYDRSKRSVVGV
jgi:taurine dioxygenase